jgi:hypothetical protein
MDIDDYYRTMGNSRICPIPDGTSIDTYHYLEACGSGCVVVTTPKPALWYYKDAPVFYIQQWEELTKDYVESILKQDIEALRIKTLNYYRECLSEEAVANYVINIISNKV